MCVGAGGESAIPCGNCGLVSRDTTDNAGSSSGLKPHGGLCGGCLKRVLLSCVPRCPPSAAVVYSGIVFLLAGPHGGGGEWPRSLEADPRPHIHTHTHTTHTHIHTTTYTRCLYKAVLKSRITSRSDRPARPSRVRLDRSPQSSSGQHKG